ncbi:MAG: hypothetical protein H7A21_04225 [Spirochaetales bacterium]|nr:hypothetical protein [Leptospiraceae bacterium]MCP5480620.1 hypothetical protein [Spirochaetales bacterium]MCP5483972.1 hypothetical protein [Spirochaetales bacterium]
MELPAEAHAEIVSLCNAGDECLERDDFAGGLAFFDRALRLVPEPKDHWEASTWIFAARGDAHFLQGNHGEAAISLRAAMKCPGGPGNPFVSLRLGQSLLETGEAAEAQEYLLRAFMAEGESIFADADPKYIGAIRHLI